MDLKNMGMNFVIQKTLQPGSVYLIGIPWHSIFWPAILKSEQLRFKSLEHGFDFISMGKKNTNDRNQAVAAMGATPQVKKSIRITAEIIAHVTGEYSISQIRTFNKVENGILAQKLLAWDQTHPDGLNRTLQDIMGDVWFVMTCYDNLADFGDFDKLDKIFAMIQENTNCFESLGSILVCDLFFGNVDRIGPLVGVKKPYVWNAHNLFLTWDASHPLRFLGIDYLDTKHSLAPYLGVPWNQLLPLIQAAAFLDDTEVGQNIIRNFELLQNGKTKARDAAVYVIDAIANWFKRKQFGNKPKAVKALRQGMHDGRTRLEKFFKKRIHQAEWPRGLESRFKALGW